MVKHLYIKKPIPVEAYQWDGTTEFAPTKEFQPTINDFGDGLKLCTEEGWMVLRPGAFIVKGPAGEYWAVQEEFFLNTYSAVPQDFDLRPHNCSARIWDEGGVAPRTCRACGLGPCKKNS